MVIRFVLIARETTTRVLDARYSKKPLERRTGNIVRMIARMEERVSIEPNHLVCNAVLAKIISDKLGDEEHNLDIRIGLGTSGLQKRVRCRFYHCGEDVR